MSGKMFDGFYRSNASISQIILLLLSNETRFCDIAQTPLCAVRWLFIDLIRHLASNQSSVSLPCLLLQFILSSPFPLSLHLYRDL